MATGTSERIVELQIAENCRSRFLAQIEVEVACQDNWHIRGELMNVVAELRELSVSKRVVPAAFEVRVIQNQPSLG